MALAEVTGLKKSFVAPDGSALKVIDVPVFSVEESAQVGLRGRSGMGKTTFLHLLAGILKPDVGLIRLDGIEVSGLDEAERDRVRALKMGYIFQTFNLLPA